MTPYEFADLWSEVWEQLPEGLQRKAQSGDLRIAIQCDDLTEGPRIVTFTNSFGTCLEFKLPADGRFTDEQIWACCA